MSIERQLGNLWDRLDRTCRTGEIKWVIKMTIKNNKKRY